MPPALEEALQTNEPPSPTSGILHKVHLADGQWHPETIISTLPSQPAKHTPSPLPFMHILERLKTTKREGWRRFKIDHGESISDHMYRMSIITLLCPPTLASKLDIARCTRMALIHDMAELLVGDITPVDGVAKSEKSRREAETMDYLCTGLLGKVHGGVHGREIREAWQEYEDGETLESKFMHDVDKMELLLQMVEYERHHESRIDLGEFTWVARKIVLPEVQDWAEEVLKERRELWAEHGKVPSGVQDISEQRQKQQEEYHGNGHAKTNGSS